EGQLWLYAERIMQIPAPTLLQFVEIVGRASLGGILPCFLVVGKAAPDGRNALHPPYQGGVQRFCFGSDGGTRSRKIAIEIAQSRVTRRQPQRQVLNAVRCVPIVILLTIEVHAKADRVPPVLPCRVI